MIEWPQRCRKKTVPGVVELRRYQSPNSPYAVMHSKSLLGLGERWLSVRNHGSGEHILDVHRSRATAERRCEDDLKGK